MNYKYSVIALISMFVNVIYGQYYPHRSPVSPKVYDPSANRANPFQRAYDNQGYYQKFTDYGSQKTKPSNKPIDRTNTYISDNKEGKGEEGEDNYSNYDSNDDNYEDNAEMDFDSNLDYNDLTGTKDFDPFKFVKDSVSGFDGDSDFGGLGGGKGAGDDSEYDSEYFKSK